MKRAFIYTRVSTEEQAKEGQSLNAQRKICRRFAEGESIEIRGIYEDPGRSGSDPNRPGLKEMIQECEADASVDTIITQDIDRLARDTFIFLSILKDLQKLGVEVRFVNQPNVDAGIDGMLVGTIQAAVSTFTAKQTGRKAKATMLEKAKDGWWPSWAPAGYVNITNPKPTGRLDKRIVAPSPENAPLLKKAFEMYAAGNYSILKIQNWLNDNGYVTRNGIKIPYSKVGTILSSPFYYGWMSWSGVERWGKHEPLVSKKTFDLCQEILAKNRNYACRKRKHNFLLRGFITCNVCGMRYTAEWHNINSQKHKGRIAYYHCNKRTGCTQPYVEATNLEAQIEELFGNYQFSDQFIDRVTKKVKKVVRNSRVNIDGQKATLSKQAKSLEAKRKRVEDLLVDGVMDRETFKRMHAELDGQIADLEGKIAGLEGDRRLDFGVVEEVLALTRNIKQAYTEAQPKLKRLYLRLFFEELKIQDGKIAYVKAQPLFQALFEAHEVIISKDWLRGVDSNHQPTGYTVS